MSEPNNIDILMDLDPLQMTPENINDIIAYYRQQRSGGPKPKREAGPSAKIDLGGLGLVKAPEPMKRRV